jgi:hypothetical protein
MFAISMAPRSILGVDSTEVIPGCRNEPGVPVWGIPIRVFTQAFKVVEGLRAEDFLLTENQSIQRLCSFAHRREPSSIGILLDASGSMRFKFNNLAIAVAGINHLLDTSGPDDEYFLEHGNDAGTGQYAFSQDVNTLRAKLRISSKGKTSLVDCIYRALPAMHRAHHVNRALLVFSDAYDNASHHRTEELIQTLSTSPVPVFLIVPFDPIERVRPSLHPSEELAAREDLSRLATLSGGGMSAASSKKEMIATVGEVATAIRSPYVLYFESAGRNLLRPSDIHIEVRNVHHRPLLLYRGARQHVRQPASVAPQNTRHQ